MQYNGQFHPASKNTYQRNKSYDIVFLITNNISGKLLGSWLKKN